MVEYIEREALEGSFDAVAMAFLKKEDNLFDRKSVLAGMSVVAGIVHTVPAADVAPVVHGRWIMRGGHFHCSSCDAKAKWDRKGGTGGWSHEYMQAKTPYCPVCGAKMDLQEG